MEFKINLDGLMACIRELEVMTAEVREQESIPSSFFPQAFDKSGQLINELRTIELARLEWMEQQAERRLTPAEEIAPHNDTPNHTLNHTPDHTRSLKEIVEKRSLTDFKKSFSLNDRFLFKKELFGGNERKMTKAINDLSEMTSLEDAMKYIDAEMAWDMGNTFVVDFVSRLEKRFN